MKKTTRIAALSAAAALIFGGLFFSCDEPGEDGGTIGTTLPESVGDNPLFGGTAAAEAEIRLSEGGTDQADLILVMKPDGTAEFLYENETEYVYRYTWNTSTKEICMKVDKIVDPNDSGKLYTYSEATQNLDKILLTQIEERYKEKKEDSAEFEKDYPTLDSYKNYLATKNGYQSFDAYFAVEKEDNSKTLKALFGAAATYGYETDGGKMTLTAKFTGVKNMLDFCCSYKDTGTYVDICAYSAYYECYNNNKSAYYYGVVNTETKTIVFKLERNPGEIINATYTDNLAEGSVTVTLADKSSFMCTFEGYILKQIK